MRLFAPRSYHRASEALRAAVCNGCGPAGWRINPIPQYILRACVREACDIHDWMYHSGHNRFQADLYFLMNLMILCSRGSTWLFPFRAFMALIYFLSVYLLGWRFFGRKEGARRG